jgi:hypothetical protein
MSQESREQLYVNAISVRGRLDYQESTENVDQDQNLLNLKQENADLKVLNAKLFKSAMDALTQKAIL